MHQMYFVFLSYQDVIDYGLVNEALIFSCPPQDFH